MGNLPSEELIEFPCDFVFKAFGPAEPEGDFPGRVRRAVDKVLPVALDAMKSRTSSGGKYLCVSVLVRLQSYSQLAAIYGELQKVEGLTYLV